MDADRFALLARRRLLRFLSGAPVALAGAGLSLAPPPAQRTAAKRRGRCRGNRAPIDGRCAPASGPACDASPICRAVNVADDQTGDAAACMHTAGGNLCDAAYVCRRNADCPPDELCTKVACADGFNRCQRMCGDRAVTAA